MGTIIDIIISTILGGVLLIIALSANDLASENAFVYSGDLFVQQSLTTVVQLVERGLRNMGFGVPENQSVIIGAGKHSITYLIDFNRNRTVDTVSYWIGPISELADTQNDSDRVLYRRVRPGTALEQLSSIAGEDLSQPHAIGYVTRFDLMYYSQAQLDTLPPPVAPSDLPLIRIIEITIEVQNPYAPYKRTVVQPGEQEGLFSSSMWRQTRLVSRNLSR